MRHQGKGWGGCQGKVEIGSHGLPQEPRRLLRVQHELCDWHIEHRPAVAGSVPVGGWQVTCHLVRESHPATAGIHRSVGSAGLVGLGGSVGLSGIQRDRRDPQDQSGLVGSAGPGRVKCTLVIHAAHSHHAVTHPSTPRNQHPSTPGLTLSSSRAEAALERPLDAEGFGKPCGSHVV